jgi:hypothetical protein
VIGLRGIRFLKSLDPHFGDLAKHRVNNTRSASSAGGVGPPDRLANCGVVWNAVHQEQLRGTTKQGRNDGMVLAVPRLTQERFDDRAERGPSNGDIAIDCDCEPSIAFIERRHIEWGGKQFRKASRLRLEVRKHDAAGRGHIRAS